MEFRIPQIIQKVLLIKPLCKTIVYYKYINPVVRIVVEFRIPHAYRCIL